MPFTHVVVDGSNIATEGRSIPSLAQLDEAVREFQAEFPQAEITVVVDATFGHRIDSSERPAFDEAQAHGELVSPPAGAIGRGDAFLLRIADRAGATVLSNDSFQEFHGEYEWLFTKDRLIGGKPVPGVGWIFTPRTPVRGPKSRESIRDARRGRVRVGSKEASRPMPVPKSPPPRPGSGAARPKTPLSDAIAAATAEVVSPEAPTGGRRRRRRGGGPPPEAVNDPLTFISFIAEHPLGSEVEGEVDSFASHGSFVVADGARCYLPLSAMGDPPPRSGREVLDKGERRTFILQALDPQRRGIELAMPGFAKISGAPQQETVEAEIASTHPEPPARQRAKATEGMAHTGSRQGQRQEPPAAPRARARKASSPELPPGPEPGAGQPARAGSKQTAAKKTAAKKTAAKKTAAKKTAAKKTAAKEAASGTPPVKESTAKKSTAKKSTAKKSTAKKSTAKKSTAKKSTAAKQMAPVHMPTGTAPTAAAPEKAVGSISAAKRAPKESAAEAADQKKVPGKGALPKKAPAAKAVATEPASGTVSVEAAPGDGARVKKAAGRKAAPGGMAPANRRAAEKAQAAISAQKTPAQKTPARQTAAKKIAAKKAPAQKTAAKKAPAQKTAAKKAPAQKAAAKKTQAQKTPAKKTPAKKRTIKKEPAPDLG